jgi:hypothetical protein
MVAWQKRLFPGTLDVQRLPWQRARCFVFSKKRVQKNEDINRFESVLEE